MTRAAEKGAQREAGDPIKIPLDQIELRDRLRDPHPDDVRGIQISMSELGLMTPISVRPIKDGKYRLIYGAHRLIAARNLKEAGVSGWEEIAAFIVECNDYEARLREIDENLKRAELTPYDKSTFLEENHRIWVEWHGHNWGGDRTASSKISNLKKPEFFRETAERLGLDETTVRLAVNRRKKASPGLWARLRGTDITRKGVLLDRLLRHPNPHAVIDLAEAEHGGSIEAALNLKAPKEKTAPTVERVLKIIDEALALWSLEERREFLREMRGRK